MGLINEVATTKKIVCLTFDDGPLPIWTNPILEILESQNVKATFFVIGTNLLKYPDLAEKIALAGHDIGNHTYDHTRLDNLMGDSLELEIEDNNRLITDIVGYPPRFLRPPGGRVNQLILEMTRKNNLLAIGWTVNANDYLEDNKKEISDSEVDARVAQVMVRLQNGLKPGAIILMHNGNQISLKALPKIISYVRANGYQFKKLSEMFN